MNYETMSFTVENNTAIIRLTRPEAANTMTAKMMDELLDVSILCDTNPDVRAVLFLAEGPIFCAGGDLSSFVAAGDEITAKIKLWITSFHTSIALFSRMNTPIVVAVKGIAAGAGLSIVSMADYVVAGESAKFVVAYTAAGLSPDGSATYHLPRRIGDSRAREMMLTNRRLDSAMALNWGLVNQVVSDEQVDQSGIELAASLAAGSAPAMAAVKDLLRESYNNGLETQMELEARSIATLAGSPDGQEGMHAFLNKRKPVFNKG